MHTHTHTHTLGMHWVKRLAFNVPMISEQRDRLSVQNITCLTEKFVKTAQLWRPVTHGVAVVTYNHSKMSFYRNRI